MSAPSGTPLWQKIGIVEGNRVAVLDLPKHVAKLLKGVPDHEHVEADADIVWWFAPDVQTFEHGLDEVKTRMRPDGMLWISWPTKGSPLRKDLKESTIREAALLRDLVDVKVCSVDDDWSGVKLVARSESA